MKITDNVSFESINVSYASWSPSIDDLKVELRVKAKDILTLPVINYRQGIFNRRTYDLKVLPADVHLAVLAILEADALAIYRYALVMLKEQSCELHSKFNNTVVLATNNKDKIAEFRRLAGNNVTLRPMSEYGVGDVDETETTYFGNALLKAEAACAATGLPCLADDSGIEVYGLKGEPGVYSARYAPTPKDRRERMLAELKNEKNRNARQVCTLVYRTPSQTHVFSDSVEGIIIDEERGNSGFGYDPIFLYQPTEKTLAEMSAEEKDKISHRGKAFAQFLQWYTAQF